MPDVWRRDDGGEPRRAVATFWAPATPGSRYVRCDLPARALPGKVQALAELGPGALFIDDFGQVRIAGQEGAMVWSFPGAYTEYRMIEGAMAYGHRAFVDVDDCYLRPNWGTEESGTWTYLIGQDRSDPRSLEGHRKIVGLVDGVICASERLCEAYVRVNPNVHLCPNAVDPTDWPRDPFSLKADDGKIRVGYAVSHSHFHDLPLVADALREASRLPNVEVVAFGVDRPEWRFPYLFVPWRDSLADLRLDLARTLDVGLAPVGRARRWGQYRSDVKLLEYAMAGACPVVSDEPPYATWGRGEVLKARDGKEFTEHVLRLCADPQEARERARTLRGYVEEERSIERTIGLWRDVLDPAEGRAPADDDPRPAAA